MYSNRIQILFKQIYLTIDETLENTTSEDLCVIAKERSTLPDSQNKSLTVI